MHRLLTAAIVFAVLAAPQSRAPAADATARSGYTGSAACGACHASAYASWRTTAHAGAGDRIAGVTGSRARRCQGCHTTGAAPAGRAVFAGVGCEACHGAGARYAERDIMRNPTLARALGLRDLSTPALRAALCDECHFETTRLARFDVAAAWKQIAHGREPR